jgi:hypothetical protein
VTRENVRENVRSKGEKLYDLRWKKIPYILNISLRSKGNGTGKGKTSFIASEPGLRHFYEYISGV